MHRLPRWDGIIDRGADIYGHAGRMASVHLYLSLKMLIIIMGVLIFLETAKASSGSTLCIALRPVLKVLGLNEKAGSSGWRPQFSTHSGLSRSG